MICSVQRYIIRYFSVEKICDIIILAFEMILIKGFINNTLVSGGCLRPLIISNYV